MLTKAKNKNEPMPKSSTICALIKKNYLSTMRKTTDMKLNDVKERTKPSQNDSGSKMTETFSKLFKF